MNPHEKPTAREGIGDVPDVSRGVLSSIEDASDHLIYIFPCMHGRQEETETLPADALVHLHGYVVILCEGERLHS